MIGAPTTTVQGPRESSDVVLVARSLNAGGLSTPFRDAPAGVMVLFAVVHLDWLDGAAANVYIDSPCFCRLLRGTSPSGIFRRCHARRCASVGSIIAAPAKCLCVAQCGSASAAVFLHIGFCDSFELTAVIPCPRVDRGRVSDAAAERQETGKKLAQPPDAPHVWAVAPASRLPRDRSC